MKKLFLIGFGLLLIPFVSTASAAEIEDLELRTYDQNVTIQWKGLSNDIMSSVEGYAVQWSKYQNNVRINETDNVRRWETTSRNYIDSMLIPTIFDKNETYYLRVYTWTKEGPQNRDRALGNGSQIIKFDVDNTYKIENIEYLEPNDPVIADNTTTNTVTGAEFPDVDFGAIRVTRFDDYAYLYWSRANLTSSDADGRMLVLSEDEDLDDPVLELAMPLSTLSAKIENLNPSTTYFMKGYFYVDKGGEKQKYGQSERQKFETTQAMTPDQERRLKSLRQRGLIKTHIADVTGYAGSGSNSVDLAENESDTSSNSSTNSSNSSPSKTYTKAQIQKKIRDLEAELNQWKQKLRTLTGNSAYNSNTSNSANSTTGMTVQERLAAIRAANAKKKTSTTPSGKNILSIQERMRLLFNK